MLLQFSLHHPSPPLSSSLSYSNRFPIELSNTILYKPLNPRRIPSIACSISQIDNYGTLDYERRPSVKWNNIYRRISMMEKPELGAKSVLNRCENEGKKLTKWELCRVVKELRKFKRHKQALEVYEWMNNRGERFRLSTSDAAIQLDLIAKVQGLSSAEDFFLRLPDSLKDNRIHGALLNAYARSKLKDKAESLMDKMREKGYLTHPLPFNVMMTLYMNLKDYEKVDLMVSEMVEKNIQLDIYSYNIWLSSCGSQGSVEKMEEVFEQMNLKKTINPNWTTFSTMATMYIKMGMFEKAEECLRKVESRITGRNRIPYHYLLTLYGSVGKKEEIHRVWKIYNAMFPSIPNLGYHAMVAALLKVGDIEGAEKIYEQWLQVKSFYDSRITNLLMGYYVREGQLEKAETLYEQMVEVGGKPNSSTWEILAEGQITEKRISEALSCWKEAFSTEGSRSWRPKPVNITSFFNLCDEEGDAASKEEITGLLRETRFLEDENYASLVGLYSGSFPSNNPSVEKDEVDTGLDSDNEDDGSEMLVNQL